MKTSDFNRLSILALVGLGILVAWAAWSEYSPQPTQDKRASWYRPEQTGTDETTGQMFYQHGAVTINVDRTDNENTVWLIKNHDAHRTVSTVEVKAKRRNERNEVTDEVFRTENNIAPLETRRAEIVEFSREFQVTIPETVWVEWAN